MAFLDAAGRLLAIHEADRDEDSFSATAEEAKGLAELMKKADGGDKEAQVEYFLKGLDLRHFKVDEARTRAAKLALTDDQKREVAGKLVNLEIDEVMATVNEDKKTGIAAGRKFAEMKQAGRIPEDDERIQPFWVLMLAHAEDRKDVALFVEALGVLKEKYGDNPNAKKFFEDKEAVLKKLKEGTKK